MMDKNVLSTFMDMMDIVKNKWFLNEEEYKRALELADSLEEKVVREGALECKLNLEDIKKKGRELAESKRWDIALVLQELSQYTYYKDARFNPDVRGSYLVAVQAFIYTAKRYFGLKRAWYENLKSTLRRN